MKNWTQVDYCILYISETSSYVEICITRRQDCQPMVVPRCRYGEVRLAQDRQCTGANQYQCKLTCGNAGGEFLVDYGVCACRQVTDPLQLCSDEQCSQQPKLRVLPTGDGGVKLQMLDPKANRTLIKVR